MPRSWPGGSEQHFLGLFPELGMLSLYLKTFLVPSGLKCPPASIHPSDGASPSHSHVPQTMSLTCPGICHSPLDCLGPTRKGRDHTPRLPALLPMRLFTGFNPVLWKPEPSFLSAGLGSRTWPCLGLCTLRKPDVRLAHQNISRK